LIARLVSEAAQTFHEELSARDESFNALYATDPVRYSKEILGVEWWAKQQEIAEALLKYRRVLVRASHSIGKTHVAAGLVNWHFDCFEPSITLTTAPTKLQVKDVLWKEVRVQRQGRPGLLPKDTRMETAPDHFAVGMTSNKSDAFQGRHEKRVLIIFDEGTGVEGAFWDAAEGMMTSEDCFWLVILNPTDTASRAYAEEMGGGWHIIEVSALDHPNVVAELAGLPPVAPAAVRLEWVLDKLDKWCTKIHADERKPEDIEFPVGSGNWYRPGPLFEGRVLGRWPTSGLNSVWSEAAWKLCLIEQPVPSVGTQIGCDVARFGDDDTDIFVRRGNCFLHHESHNGWSTSQVAGRLKQLAVEYASPSEAATQIPITIDDDGVGGGVVDQAEDFNFVPVKSGWAAIEDDQYPNVRSELWFNTRQRANEGRIDVSRLSKESRQQLFIQLMAPTWKLDSSGRRVVEPKHDTKKRLKRSPDSADAFNIALYNPVQTDHGFAVVTDSSMRAISTYKPR
jgi:hypothetical protein